MSESEMQGIKEWIERLQTEGNERHEANVAKIAVLQTRADEQDKLSIANGEKLDKILDILSKGKGVVLVFKVGAWLVGTLAAVIGLWAMLKQNGHP